MAAQPVGQEQAIANQVASARFDSIAGDGTGLAMPAHPSVLQAMGPKFLTEAFRAFGTIAPDNAVTAIRRIEPCAGGSTGQKVFLSVDYAQPAPDLPGELFAKFSRDFDAPLRDRGRFELQAEVRFCEIARSPGFPIAVPRPLFADFHAGSGTGLLITERIAFGAEGIEPHREKCMDHATLADPLEHYRAILGALARLAGAHWAGRLSPDISDRFPFDPEVAAAAIDPIRHDERQLAHRVARYAEFAVAAPQLLPEHVRSPAFIERMTRDVYAIKQQEAAIRRFLVSEPDLIALCHWNANIDNAWFRRDGRGTLQCGLLDWGRVSQMNLAFALWGCLSAADLALWQAHFGELLGFFSAEYAAHGGPRVDPETLRLHLSLYVALMGLAWLIDAPALIPRLLPGALTASSPTDPLFAAHEAARTQLHMLTLFLDLWEREDFGVCLARIG